MKWNTEYFGFRLLVFVGFCGEVPVALLRKAGGCYDYRRRVVTELVRTGYLKERKFRGERRRVVRSLSLTSRGLNQIQHLSPGRAEQIRARRLAPPDGQGDWRRTKAAPPERRLPAAGPPAGGTMGPGQAQGRRQAEGAGLLQRL